VVAARRWRQWPGRTVQELNGVSGVAGLGGIAIGAGSFAVLTGAAALALTGVGAVIVGGAAVYAAVRGIPPVLRPAEELVGQTVELQQLEDVYPPIPKLAIIGPSQAGKTTLRNRLSFDVSQLTRTQHITCYVTSLQTSPPKYLAILDGGGERFAQQFKLAEVCDYLCVVIDHNVSDSDSEIDKDRLAEHEEFLRQVKHYLDESHSREKLWVHFLINKHDLWVSETAKQRNKLDAFGRSETEKWRQAKRAKRVDYRPHSNNSADDLGQFMAVLKGK
jgi:hypothetical protein